MLDAPESVLAERIAEREGKTTDKLYTETTEARLQIVRNRYHASRYLHADLVRDWLFDDTVLGIADDVARKVAIHLEM